MNENWARSWCEAMSSGDTGRARTFYASQVAFEDIPFEMAASVGEFDAVLEHFVGSGNNRFTFARFSGGAKGGAVESIWRADHADEFLGVAAAGKSSEVRLVTILEFDGDGLIRRHCDYWDARAVLAQLGGD